MRDVPSRGRTRTPEDIAAWRAERLRAARFPAPLAEQVARNASYELPALLELIDRGCPPELAVRILAPLSGQVPEP
jgi:hypothetical protein